MNVVIVFAFKLVKQFRSLVSADTFIPVISFIHIINKRMFLSGSVTAYGAGEIVAVIVVSVNEAVFFNTFAAFYVSALTAYPVRVGIGAITCYNVIRPI